MKLAASAGSGLALGAWGAVHATATGIGIASGGALRDAFTALMNAGYFGPAVSGPAAGYAFVYQIEVFLLFATLVAIGPLARHAAQHEGPRGAGSRGEVV